QPIDQMDLGSNRELRARRRLGDGLDDLVSRAQRVRLLANLPAALRMGNHVNIRMLLTDTIHVLGQKALMHGAMALPKDYALPAQPFRSLASHDLVWVPNRHL